MGIIALPAVAFHYAVWHYTEAIREIVTVWRNIVWFVWNFFSVGLLFKTLFSPWRRIQEKAPKGLDLEAIGSAIAVNLMMRIVGFFLRLFVGSIGLFITLICLVCGVASVIVWILFPVIIPGLISIGFASLFI